MKIRYSEQIAPNPLIEGGLTDICNKIHKTRVTSLILALGSINRGRTNSFLAPSPKIRGEPAVVFLHYRKSGVNTRFQLLFKRRNLVLPLSHY